MQLLVLVLCCEVGSFSSEVRTEIQQRYEDKKRLLVCLNNNTVFEQALSKHQGAAIVAPHNLLRQQKTSFQR